METMTEIKVEPLPIPECEIRYITVYYWNGSEPHWTSCYHTKLRNAEAEQEWAVPGTFRLFEVPKMEAKNGDTN